MEWDGMDWLAGSLIDSGSWSLVWWRFSLTHQISYLLFQDPSSASYPSNQVSTETLPIHPCNHNHSRVLEPQLPALASSIIPHILEPMSAG